MAKFNGVTLTKSGRALLVKALTGKVLNFTHIFVGDGYPPEGQSLTDTEQMSHSLHEMDIQAIEIPEKVTGTVRIRAVLTNKNLETGFFIREIGLFAQDPDTGEDILYSYCNAGDEADFMPAQGGGDAVEYLFNLVTVVDQAQNVTASLAEGVVFITPPELERRIDVFFGEPEPVRGFWTSTEGDERKFRPASLETVRMAINGTPDIDSVKNQIDQLAEASILQSLRQSSTREKLDSEIEKERQERIAADEAEKVAREQADRDEAAARSNADSALQTNIGEEATTRSNADNTLQTKINSEASTRASAITTEANARSAEDTRLWNAINSEASTRASADTAEASARATVAANLAAHISSTTAHANLPIAALYGNLPTSRISGTFAPSKISGLDDYVKSLSSGITDKSLSTNGYVIFGNGLIIQWGRFAAGVQTVNFPITFPHTCYVVHRTTVDPTTNTDSSTSGHGWAASTGGAVLEFSRSSITRHPSSQHFVSHWFAIGY